MEDAEMIKLFVERKEKAISEVDASYGEKLHRIAFKILQNHADAEMDAPTQLVDPRGMSGDIQSSADQNGIIVLDRNSINYSPVNGVSIQSIGYIGDTLRVQVYYEEILKTDNHGFISLQNKETGELLPCDGSVAFFDANGSGSYEEYIFTNVPLEMLPDYALYGEFITSEHAVEGNWTVTFPMENIEAEV